ncbi:MAG: glycosyltransferase family 2 protein [Bacilli bacterium]|nr:glycosyltransferase family 2 protein [Bacilli bacterium]
MPKISVIVPVYNSSKYLRQCLDSIFNQTYKDFELITINDCSTDDSLKILLEYSRLYSNMKIINNEINLGAGVSRNRGIEISNGEYIMFVDSDDYIELNTLEDAIKCAVNNSSDIVRYDFNRVIGRKEFDYRIFDPSFEGKEKSINIEKDDYLFKENSGACNKLFSRKLIGDTRFAEGILFEDTPFTISNLFNAENIVYLKKTLYKYRFNPKSTMGSNLFHVNKRILDILSSMDKIDEFVKDDRGLGEQLNSLKSINCVHIFNDLILWKEFSIKEKQMLYSYLIRLIELKYGPLDSDYAFNLTRDHDSFFRNRMKFMRRYFVKDEYSQSNNINELKERALRLINQEKN